MKGKLRTENLVSLDRLKECLEYRPESGLFVWKVAKRGTKIGDVAGYSNEKNKYIVIGIDQTYYYAHRLAWFYSTGVWPKAEVDHINLCRTDNRICNLRECSSQENKQNLTLRTDNTSGYTGVTWMSSAKKYRTRINHNGKEIHVGLFASKEEAVAARKNAKQLLHTFNPK